MPVITSFKLPQPRPAMAQVGTARPGAKAAPKPRQRKHDTGCWRLEVQLGGV